jgi:UDP-N-acetylmuramoylalanine--D-glutamate ligase
VQKAFPSLVRLNWPTATKAIARSSPSPAATEKHHHGTGVSHLQNGGLDCALVGNIGYSFAKQVAKIQSRLYVAEISSFQLDDIVTFRPDVAVLLNITEDHLDRYDYKFENYIRSKFRIAMNQTSNDYFIYNMDDEVIMGYLTKPVSTSIQLPMSMKQKVKKGAYIKEDEMHVKPVRKSNL